MKLYIRGRDVTGLVSAVTTSGALAECARTLTAEIVQSPEGRGVPSVDLSEGGTVLFEADGQSFTGVLLAATRSTSSRTVSVTAKDMGTYVKRNKIVAKLRDVTPAEATRTLCEQAGVPVGDLADTAATFSRSFMGVTLYEAIMTAYTLCGEGRKYRITMEGTSLCVRPQGETLAGVVRTGVNLIDAAYTADAGAVVTAVDVYDSSGKLLERVESGLTGLGEVREAVIMSSDRDGARERADALLREGAVQRRATVQNLGDPLFVTGSAVLVEEPFTGLYGRFYIESDVHTWRKGLYTNKLTLAWENTMDEKEAGEEIRAAKAKRSGGTNKPSGEIIFRLPNGEVIK